MWVAVAHLLLGQVVAQETNPLAADYSHLGWGDAFVALNRRLARFYPFSISKRLNWSELEGRFLDRIVRAESLGDSSAFYLALREFTYSIPDGHVALSGENSTMASLADQAVGASFGLRLVELEDGSVLVSQVVTDGPAAEAGVKVGAQVLRWNGTTIRQALEKVPTTWADVPPPTQEGLRLERLSWLTRAPLATTIRVRIRNPGATPRTVSLTSADDEGLLEDLSPFPSPSELRVPIDYGILPSGFGYLRISSFEASTKKKEKRFHETLQAAITQFRTDRVPGVIVDLRRNVGGLNRLVVSTAGFFYSRRTHFETVTAYDAESDRFEVNEDDPESRLYVTPQAIRYRGPLAIMVGYGCMSGAEGLALALQSLPTSKVIGIHGSHGSYGISSAEVELPEGLKFEYPYGRSLNARGKLRLDSNHNGQGGVTPDIRVALTPESFRAKYIANRDIEMEAAEKYLESLRNAKNGRPHRTGELAHRRTGELTHRASRLLRRQDTVGACSKQICRNQARTKPQPSTRPWASR